MSFVLEELIEKYNQFMNDKDHDPKLWHLKFRFSNSELRNRKQTSSLRVTDPIGFSGLITHPSSLSSPNYTPYKNRPRRNQKMFRRNHLTVLLPLSLLSGATTLTLTVFSNTNTNIWLKIIFTALTNTHTQKQEMYKKEGWLVNRKKAKMFLTSGLCHENGIEDDLFRFTLQVSLFLFSL